MWLGCVTTLRRRMRMRRALERQRWRSGSGGGAAGGGTTRFNVYVCLCVLCVCVCVAAFMCVYVYLFVRRRRRRAPPRPCSALDYSCSRDLSRDCSSCRPTLLGRAGRTAAPRARDAAVPADSRPRSPAGRCLPRAEHRRAHGQRQVAHPTVLRAGANCGATAAAYYYDGLCCYG